MGLLISRIIANVFIRFDRYYLRKRSCKNSLTISRGTRQGKMNASEMTILRYSAMILILFRTTDSFVFLFKRLIRSTCKFQRYKCKFRKRAIFLSCQIQYRARNIKMCDKNCIFLSVVFAPTVYRSFNFSTRMLRNFYTFRKNAVTLGSFSGARKKEREKVR